jgi:hypothetical protein
MLKKFCNCDKNNISDFTYDKKGKIAWHKKIDNSFKGMCDFLDKIEEREDSSYENIQKEIKKGIDNK